MTTHQHPLAHLIPSSNQLDLRALSSSPEAKTSAIEAAYIGGLCGAFDAKDNDSWAKRIAAYDHAEFLADTDGDHLFSEIHDELSKDEGDGCHVYTQLAFDTYRRDKASDSIDWLFRGAQDSGICVDASNTAMKQGFFGIRASDPQYGEIYKYLPAYWTYQYRGYCGAGWSGSACATQNKNHGAALAKRYSINGDFDYISENTTERYVTSTWCRSDCPQWLEDYAEQNHPWDGNAITYFDGGVDALRTLFQNKGQFHHGSNATSANSKPNTWRRIGGHMQTAFGGDWSDRTMQWFRDKGCSLSNTPGNFWVANHQLWGPGWSGQCGSSYWPSWWGEMPEGAWVCGASELLSRVDGYAYLPGVKGIPGETPTPGPINKIIIDPVRYEVVNGRPEILNEFEFMGRKFIITPRPFG